MPASFAPVPGSRTNARRIRPSSSPSPPSACTATFVMYPVAASRSMTELRTGEKSWLPYTTYTGMPASCTSRNFANAYFCTRISGMLTWNRSPGMTTKSTRRSMHSCSAVSKTLCSTACSASSR